MLLWHGGWSIAVCDTVRLLQHRWNDSDILLLLLLGLIGDDGLLGWWSGCGVKCAPDHCATLGDTIHRLHLGRWCIISIITARTIITSVLIMDVFASSAAVAASRPPIAAADALELLLIPTNRATLRNVWG